MAISRRLPPALGYRLADFVAARIVANRETPMIQTIRANQWVVSGGKLSAQELDQAATGVLRNTARAFYNLFHYLGKPAELEDFIAYSPVLEELIERSRAKQRGVIVVGLHMSNFDLVMQAAARRGLQGVGLTMPEATEAIEWQHAMRREAGVEIMPATLANLRQAIRRLEAGELFLTGADRPMEGGKCRPRFFGRPANLPVHYVQLALKARVPVILLAAVVHEDGRCHILASDYLEMQPHSDRETEMVMNAERVLEVAAQFIRQAPRQWSVFQPVWPDLMKEVP